MVVPIVVVVVVGVTPGVGRHHVFLGLLNNLKSNAKDRSLPVAQVSMS